MSSTIEKKIFFLKNLKILRKENNLSTSGLSKIINISKNTIENYEFKNSFPPMKVVGKITNYYGVSIDYLLNGEHTEYIKNLQLFKIAAKIDKFPFQEMTKVQSYIDTFLDTNKKANRHYDNLNYSFTDNFNNNFKELIIQNNLTTKEMANKLKLTERQIISYKNSTECSYESLIDISNIFHISTHWIVTGEKLLFDFQNKGFEKLIFNADCYLKKDNLKSTINLMQKIIENSNIPVDKALSA